MPHKGATSPGSSLNSLGLSRFTRGTTFLALEHVLYLFFTLTLAGLIVCGSVATLALWTGESLLKPGAVGSFFVSGWAIWLAAGLLSLGPLVWLLHARTRAELSKRPGFTGRLAYKVPLYIALGVGAVVKVGAWVTLVSVLLFSLASIGIRSEMAMAMWVSQLVPAFLTIVVFGVTNWFLLKRAKGADNGRNFTQLLVSVSVLLGVALFVSAAIALQSTTSIEFNTPPTVEDALRSYMEPPRADEHVRGDFHR
ncbi:MAG TPA: hypothetical protein VFT87_04075 [Candidatus Saccharimonadales bacterium]|nr:hypothetical protein [Candidatus Saccharimonadales bacterium]